MLTSRSSIAPRRAQAAERGNERGADSANGRQDAGPGHGAGSPRKVLGALAVADSRERTRRPGYLVTLVVSVALGYLALLPASSHYVIMNAPEYRGVYNSAWAGTALLLSAAWIWPMLIWSRLGAQRRENGLESLLGCSPEIFRQLTAQWLSGLALTPPLPGSGQ